MNRIQLPTPVYTGDSANWCHFTTMKIHFWNSYELPDMGALPLDVDSRDDHHTAAEMIRKILTPYASMVTVNHLNEEMFVVQAHNKIMVSVRNLNHRSNMKNRINQYRMMVYGDYSECVKVCQEIQSALGKEHLVKVNWFYKTGHGLENTNLHIQANENPIKDEFYPWLPRGVDAFVQEYMQHTSSVLVLYGPPGTGKTSFLRHLLTSTQSNAMITYDERVIQNDSFFVDYLTDDDHDVMIVEDADVLLAPREDGANHFMSKFLNVSDGLIRVLNKKMVFTTNITQLGRIDPALLRAGRCFAAVNFRELTAAEAARAAQAAGMPSRDWHSKDHWSLAELWGDQQCHTGVAQERFKVGFV
jgi:hypothetical protein